MYKKHIEKPTDYRSLFKDTSNVTSMAKTQKDLIKEIAMLEVEIIYLERLLLTKYRKAFDNIDIDDQQVLSSFHQTEVNEKIKILGSKGENLQTYNFKDSSLLRSVNYIKKHSRCLSSLSQQSLCSDRISALKENSTNSTRFYHLEPLHPEKHDQNSTPNIISLAEHFGTSITDHVPQTPNRLSEDIIRCLSGIYFKLGTVSVMHHGSPSSSTSSLSSMSELSSQHVDTWSPNCKKEPSVDIKSENHFQYEELNELKGSYSLMIQVSQICRDDQKMSEVGYMMKSLRSLVRCLEKIDLRKMNNQDKLAFWINIHNALIMHAYLRYGIPKSNMKRSFLLSKAAYNVGTLYMQIPYRIPFSVAIFPYQGSGLNLCSTQK